MNPQGEDFRIPTSADASRMLEEIAPVTRRSRQLARDVVFARPLLAWGLAWMAGAALFEFVPGPAGTALGLAACAVATAVNWLVRPREIRAHDERRFAVLWFVLLATSPLLVIVVAPPNAEVMTVFLGCLWAVGMLLYGIGARDRPLSAVGLGILVLAAVTRIAAPHAAMLTVGLAGGLAMAVVGGWRMRWRR